MWLKNGSDHIDVPENVEDIKQVRVLSKGMTFILIKMNRFEFMENRKVVHTPDGRPFFFYFNRAEHRVMLHPRADKRYSVTMVAWVSKLL